VRRAKRLVILFMALAYRAAQRVSRALALLSGREAKPTSLVVLTYHAVTAADRRAFERQMRVLRRAAVPVFADAPAACSGVRTVAVTFDDAFQCVFDEALPILARYEIPATIFVPTGCLGREAGWMATMSGATKVVGREQLRAADSRRVRVGSHTVTHPRLGEIERERVQAELAESRRSLEQLCGAPVTMLALPYGSSSPEVMAMAAATGYERVFANIPVAPAGGSPLVGRLDVSPSDWPVEFRLKIRGAYEWLVLAIPAKRLVLRLTKAAATTMRRVLLPGVFRPRVRGASDARAPWTS
jgi:peptidoglycan/xylan/chitin deacetylase (PgdA/CDA1 family)